MTNCRHFLRAAALVSGLFLTVVLQAQPALDDARAAIERGDLKKADALLAPATQGNGASAEAFSLLSHLRLKQHKIGEAVDCAQKATDLAPTNARYFSELGLALELQIDEVEFMQKATVSNRVRKAYLKAVELNPKDITTYCALVRFYCTTPPILGGNLMKAQEMAMRVQQLDRFVGEIQLGSVADQNSDYDVALEHFETAAKMNRHSAVALSSCGEMLAKLGEKKKAKARFEAALKIDPNFEAARKGLDDLNTEMPE